MVYTRMYYKSFNFKTMNYFRTIPILLMGIALFVSCSSEKGEEQTKMIPSSEFQLTGKHKNLLKVDQDSVEILLICVDEEDGRWAVRVNLPMANTQNWSKSKESKKYEPMMGNISVDLLDKNGSEISYYIDLDNGEEIEGLISSDELTNAIVHVSGSRTDYEKAKAVFDKTANLSISRMELREKEVEHSLSSSSSSVSDDVDDVLEEYDKALEQSKQAMDAAKAIMDLF